MAFKPTAAQKDAIYENGNILVSAAAGSGKTAVLVERVINRICDKENPVRADELLIVTFTNAAAAEMRSRVEKRLTEECLKNPYDTGLLMQKHLLAHSKICTIDSFCIDLVRENFDKLDISPDFKIVDSKSLDIINRQVMSDILSGYFEQKNQLFFELLDIVGSEFDEKNFIELILNIYEYSRQLPFPEKWFDEILKNYNNGTFSKDNIWYNYAFDSAEKIVHSMETLIDTAIENISYNDKAFSVYNGVFSDAKEIIQKFSDVVATKNWDDFFNLLTETKFARLPIARGLSEYKSVTAAKDAYKFLCDKLTEKLKKFFYADFEFINNQFKKLYKPIALLVDILKEFDLKVFEKYKQENLFTFHNTEHFALKLLYDVENNKITETAKELLQNYKEVMVDEYQDTNDLQDMLYSILSDFERKLFVVGDVKQSIYAFRGANPANFLNKKNRYLTLDKAYEGDPKKIILGNNFRSCPQICEFVNFFFSMFMQDFSGNIEYNDEEMLLPAASFPKTENKAVEMHIIDCKETSEKSIVAEAHRIAEVINETVNGKPCIKENDNELRKARYGDFAILLRSVANNAPILVSELKNCGIPVNLSVGNFAESVEISTFLSLLRVIDNPQNDIELATVMLSPIFGFTPDEMASIRSDKKDGTLYSAVIFAAENLNSHAKKFLDTLAEYRLDAVTLSLSKLISKLFITSEYLNIVSAMSDGEKRRNNLLLLSDYAEKYTENHLSSISGFIDFVLKQSPSGASAGVSSADSVKIMSIHASKGLQFPICILALCSSKFNDSETRNSAAYSVKNGLGFKYYDEDAKQKYTTLPREVILSDIKKSALEEELRLLYVAMTRAQDKLLFFSSFSDYEKSVESYGNILLSCENNVNYTLFSRTKSYADWLMISLMLHPDGKIIRGENSGIIPLNDISSVKIFVTTAENSQINSNDTADFEFSPNEDLVIKLKSNFDFSYPYIPLIDISSKFSVSEIANKAENEKYSFSALPAFMNKGGITPAEKGTAMHKVMEFFDFDNSDDIIAEVDRLYEWQFISERERESLDINALELFFNSEIFKRIKSATTVKREMKFLSEMPVSKINFDLNEKFPNETFIVQGAVDICFIENDELVIVDFKTDRVENLNDLSETYREQLSLYALACEKIFRKRVKEKIIYSFHKNKEIKI